MLLLRTCRASRAALPAHRLSAQRGLARAGRRARDGSGISAPSSTATAAAPAAAPAAPDVANWTWEGPSRATRSGRALPERDHHIAVLPGVHLVAGEVVACLEALKGVDVVAVSLAGTARESMADHLVVGTGTSGAHLRRMADAVTAAIKARKLRDCQGFLGAEGYDCDDWIVVDGGSVIVSLMDEATRRSLDLENHVVEGPNQAVQDYMANPEDEDAFDRAVDSMPIPDDYDVVDAASDKPESLAPLRRQTDLRNIVE